MFTAWPKTESSSVCFVLHLLYSKVNQPYIYMGFSGGTSGKEPSYQCRRYEKRRFDPWVKKIPWRRKWQPTPVFLSGEPHGQRIMVGYSPWGRKELDMTE